MRLIKIVGWSYLTLGLFHALWLMIHRDLLVSIGGLNILISGGLIIIGLFMLILEIELNKNKFMVVV
ncbi:MAG: hypothetical protein AABW90_02730 [Nanoarchaeota archaeon]